MSRIKHTPKSPLKRGLFSPGRIIERMRLFDIILIIYNE